MSGEEECHVSGVTFGTTAGPGEGGRVLRAEHFASAHGTKKTADCRAGPVWQRRPYSARSWSAAVLCRFGGETSSRRAPAATGGIGRRVSSRAIRKRQRTGALQDAPRFRTSLAASARSWTAMGSGAPRRFRSGRTASAAWARIRRTKAVWEIGTTVTTDCLAISSALPPRSKTPRDFAPLRAQR